MSPIEIYRRRRSWWLPKWQAEILHPIEGGWIFARHAWTSRGAEHRASRLYESLLLEAKAL